MSDPTHKHSDNTAVFEQDILKENTPKVSYIVRLFRFVFSSARSMCGLYLVLAIVLNIANPAIALLWGRYIDSAQGFALLPTRQAVQIASLVGLAVLYWFLRYLADLLERFVRGYGDDIERLDLVQANRLEEMFFSKVYRKIARLHPDYLEAARINDMIGRTFNAIGDRYDSLLRVVMLESYFIIARAIGVVMTAAALFIFSPWLGLIALAAPLPVLYNTYIGSKLRFKFSRDNWPILRRAYYYEGLMIGQNAKEVKTLNLFDFFFGKWKVLADDYLHRERKNRVRILILSALANIVTQATGVGATILAVWLLARGDISVGALGAVLTLQGTLIWGVVRLFNSISAFVAKKHDAAQFFELMDLDEQPAKTQKAPQFTGLQAQDVSYRYPLTDAVVVKNVNFTLNKGEIVAFVGENGAGKTTFVKLLTGLLQPASGQILYGGTPAADLEYCRFDNAAQVFQNNALMTTFTVGDNVALGDIARPRDEAKIDEALAFASFADAPKDEMLGRDIGGIDLSGGQWQKLAIAKAYYRGRDFVILDEPTGNLDPIAEADIFGRYIDLSRGKTVIIVTHRISAASLADRVVVFKDGEIVEDGAHTDLLAADGEYARLYNTQAAWYGERGDERV